MDHLKAIRTTKKADYYESLTESEKKSFNHWSILNGLSMDNDLVGLISSLWKDGYYDKIPSPQFYTLLIQLVPYSDKNVYWFKKSKKRNGKLLKYISDLYLVSERESEDYLDIYFGSDGGINELIKILEGNGLTEKEVEKLLIGDSNGE